MKIVTDTLSASITMSAANVSSSYFTQHLLMALSSSWDKIIITSPYNNLAINATTVACQHAGAVVFMQIIDTFSFTLVLIIIVLTFLTSYVNRHNLIELCLFIRLNNFKVNSLRTY